MSSRPASAAASVRERPESAASRRTARASSPPATASGLQDELAAAVVERPPYAGNVLLHKLYCAQDFELCLRYCSDIIESNLQNAEYALFIQGLVHRRQGCFDKALASLKQANHLNPHNVMILKELARTLFFLGKHSQALEIYYEVEIYGGRDWDICHAKGVCNSLLREYEKLAKVYAQMSRPEDAISTLQDALKCSSENADILISLGLLQLNQGHRVKAMESLQAAKKKEKQHDKISLALAAIMQEDGKIDEALSEYSPCVQRMPFSSHLWNNIGMCFFAKSKFVAAVACLKRALYLSPFDWKTAFNLGLVHIRTEQYASAFFFLNAAASINPDHAETYSLMGIALTHLNSTESAIVAYEKSLRLDPLNPMTYVNFAVCLFNNKRIKDAQEKLSIFEDIVGSSKDTQYNELAESLRTEIARSLASNN